MKNMSLALCLGVLAVTVAGSSVSADTLEMKDGRMIDGKYLGGTQYSIRFDTGGNIAVYPLDQVLALTFTSSVASLSPKDATPARTTPAPQATVQPVVYTINSGMRLPIRMLDLVEINTSRKGDWFTGMLEHDLRLNDTLIVAKGTKVRGQVVSAEQNKQGATLAVTLRELYVQDKVIQLATTNYIIQQKSQSLNVGGIATLKIAPRERALKIPYQSVVEFETTAAFSLPAPKP